MVLRAVSFSGGSGGSGGGAALNTLPAVATVNNSATDGIAAVINGVPCIITMDNLLAALGKAITDLADGGTPASTVSLEGSDGKRYTMSGIAAAVSSINGTGGGAADTTAPTASSAAVANATPTYVDITMSEAMNTSFTPAASSVTVSGHTVSALAWASATVLRATVSAAFVNGEAARTVSYTQPGTNNARDVAGNLLANFTGLAITNNVSAGSAYTVTGYSGNAVKNPINASSATVYSGWKQIVPASQGTDATYSLYWNVNATAGGAQAASAQSGWSLDGNEPIYDAAHVNNNNVGADHLNCWTTMNKAAAFENTSVLWVPVGYVGTASFYVRGPDNIAIKVVTVTITGA